MQNWSSSTCDAHEVKIHYLRSNAVSASAAKYSVVFLHGLIASGECWLPVAQAFEKKWDLILPDARGHGKSSAPDSGYSYDHHAQDVVGLIQALKLSQVVLVGHSMGGLTAAVVVAKFPQLVHALVLADPTFIDPQRQREVFASDVVDQHRLSLARSAAELTEEARRKHPHRALSILESLSRARLQTNSNAFDVLIPPNPDFQSLMSSIDVPSLLVTADRGVVTNEVASQLQQLNPKLQVSMIRNAGHGLHYDQPEEFTRSLNKFLDSLF